MYIIFNQDGSIKESQLNDYVNQYSDGVNFIDVVVYGTSPDDYTASATYTLPNGESLTDTGVYKSNIATSLGEMQGYRFTLHSAHTQYDGPLTFSLVATKTDKTQLFTYAYGIVINPSAGKKTTEVTWEEYQSLLAQLASYQLRFSSQNVIHASLTTATGMISVLPVGQVVLVSDDDDETKQDVYVVVSDATAETGKKLQMVTLGEEGLKSAYVYKDEVLGEVQAVHTGLVSHYTDKDDENIAVRYGTDEVDVPAWFVYCLDGDKYSGAITMGAKVFNFYDAHASDMPWLMNDGNLTKIVSPSRTSKLELETGSAKITANTIQVGEKLKITNQGEATNFTGSYVTFGSGTTLEIEGDTVITKDPTNDDNIATKKYVDDVASSSTYKNLNIENGTGSGSIKTKSATGASGTNSVALGLNANATAENSTAIGNGVTNNKANSVAVGWNYTVASTDPYLFAVGQTFNIFGVSMSDTYINSGKLAFTGSSSTFNGDMSVKGTLTANKVVANEFTSVKAESVSTKQYTIGLAEGNKSKIASYIGLYATAYDGSNYGALVWDNTGTAYVGDAVVNDGVVTDPNKTLQPLMTRVDASYLADGCILAWDADNLRASASPYFGISTEFGNCAYMNAPSGLFRVATGDNGLFLIDDGSTPAIELDGKVHINRPTIFDEEAEIQSNLRVNAGNYLNIDTINAYTTGNALVRYKSAEKVSAFGSSENKALLMGNADRPYYSKDGSDFNGEELALKKDTQVLFLSEDGYVCVDYDKLAVIS